MTTSRITAAISQAGEDSSRPGRDRLRDYFDAQAESRDRWIEKNRYYHDELASALSFSIPPGSSVLEIGCGTGFLLSALKPGRAVGLDMSPAMVERARRNFPEIEFRVDDIEKLEAEEKFDYVILSDLIGFLNDVHLSLTNLHRVCHRSTRIFITHLHFLWEPLLHAAENVGWKAKQPLLNWLTPADLSNLLELAGFEPIRTASRVLLPVYIPVLSTLCNRFLVNLPVLKHLGLVRLIVARPRLNPENHSLTCSVVVPCRNEKGNIEPALRRIPNMGKGTEIIFVEGDSSDGTREEIERVMAQ